MMQFLSLACLNGVLLNCVISFPPFLVLFHWLFYTVGGPDHRLNCVSVQLSLIAIFLNLDLNFICAGYKASCHSWCNPVERVMAILKFAIQCVGLMRQQMPEELERR